jgi:hypothetical protein
MNIERTNDKRVQTLDRTSYIVFRLGDFYCFVECRISSAKTGSFHPTSEPLCIDISQHVEENGSAEAEVDLEVDLESEPLPTPQPKQSQKPSPEPEPAKPVPRPERETTKPSPRPERETTKPSPRPAPEPAKTKPQPAPELAKPIPQHTRESTLPKSGKKRTAEPVKNNKVITASIYDTCSNPKRKTEEPAKEQPEVASETKRTKYREGIPCVLSYVLQPLFTTDGSQSLYIVSEEAKAAARELYRRSRGVFRI